jgi:hypothetical protein
MPKVMPKEPEDVFALLEKINELKAPAIDRLLEERKLIDKKLAMLGYNAPVASKSAPGGAKKAKAGKLTPSANYDESKHCAICNRDGHDGRKHRNMKNPFTGKQLAEMGLLSPDEVNA